MGGPLPLIIGAGGPVDDLKLSQGLPSNDADQLPSRRPSTRSRLAWKCRNKDVVSVGLAWFHILQKLCLAIVDLPTGSLAVRLRSVLSLGRVFRPPPSRIPGTNPLRNTTTQQNRTRSKAGAPSLVHHRPPHRYR